MLFSSLQYKVTRKFHINTCCKDEYQYNYLFSLSVKYFIRSYKNKRQICLLIFTEHLKVKDV